MFNFRDDWKISNNTIQLKEHIWFAPLNAKCDQKLNTNFAQVKLKLYFDSIKSLKIWNKIANALQPKSLECSSFELFEKKMNEKKKY